MSIYTLSSETALAAGSLATDDIILVADASAGYAAKKITADVLRSGIAGVVATTATSLTVTKALHANRTVMITSATPIAVAMPAATGTGDVYTFIIGVAATATPHSIAALTTDVVEGIHWVLTTTSDAVVGFITSATSDKIELNGTTKGGLPGERWVWIDSETGTWNVHGWGKSTGSHATPFAAS